MPLYQERTMSQEALLTLHCPQCKKISDVVTEGENLICLDCGYRFDEKTAARYLGRVPPTDKTAALEAAAPRIS
jgi:phage FluMu protein Com